MFCSADVEVEVRGMADNEGDALERIDRLLAQISQIDGRHRVAVAEIRRLLKTVVAAPVPTAHKRTGAKTGYTVEGDGPQATLSEHRAAGQPLRVPKSAYDQIVAVFIDSDRPMPFDDIMREINSKGPVISSPAEWQVRVVLRFLLRAKPPLLLRARSRYQPVVQAAFAVAAGKWWLAARA